MNKKTQKELTTILILFTLINIPFIITGRLIGFQALIDTFNHPTGYQYLKLNQQTMTQQNLNNMLILQKTTHPDFTLNPKDTILYINNDGDVALDTIHTITTHGPLTQIYLKSNNPTNQKNTIHNEYILGKVLTTVDNNPLTTLSLTIWDETIHHLNIHSILNN